MPDIQVRINITEAVLKRDIVRVNRNQPTVKVVSREEKAELLRWISCQRNSEVQFDDHPLNRATEKFNLDSSDKIFSPKLVRQITLLRKVSIARPNE